VHTRQFRCDGRVGDAANDTPMVTDAQAVGLGQIYPSERVNIPSA
jgi:hypothetical protein